MPRASTALPHVIVGIDPDSLSTALAWAEFIGDGQYKLQGLVGGGVRVVPWQTVTGARAWLSDRRQPNAPDWAWSTAVAIESQAPDGPCSADVEELRRVRYHWQAACEIDDHVCEFVFASAWQSFFLRDVEIGRGRGAVKAAYKAKAKSLTPLATNEDRCAALGILVWFVDRFGAKLLFE